MRRVAIIDGDIICHDAADLHWRKKVSQWELHGLNIAPLKGLGYVPGYDYTTDLAMQEKCWATFLEMLEAAVEASYCTEYVMAVKDGKSYRDEIYPQYKLKRGKYNVHNPFVEYLRKRAIKEDLALGATGKEADDLVRTWATECKEHGIEFVVGTIDKDLRCIEGTHYHLSKKELSKVSKEEGMWLYYAQLLSGDPTDHIPGLPGIGPVKAQKAIAGTEEDCQEAVVAMYLEAYGDDWESHLLSNGKMIYIQEHWNAHFTIREWPIVKELRG